jgi:hypothetical protein
MQFLCDGGTPSIAYRISRLQEKKNLEEAGRAVLKYLGELNRLYLTNVEQKLLSLIELESEMKG